jgi:outer membrane protein assembly factor BamB
MKRQRRVTGYRFYRLAALSAALAAQAFAPVLSGAADWPMFRGNAARTGAVAEQAAPPFAQAWAFTAGGGILSSPAVYGGAVYFGARDGYLYAVDAATGAELWRLRTANWVESSPAVSSGAVYAASLDGHLYAADRLTGAPLWRAALGAPSVSSPLVYGGRVYVGTGLPEKKLKVFDAATGALLGSFQAGQPVDSAPASYGGNIYFGANDGVIYALDAASLLPPGGWAHYPTAGSFRLNAVAVEGGTVYALPGHDDKRVYALDAATGNEQRKSAPVEAVESWQTFTAPAVAGGRLYFAGAVGAPDEYTAAGGNYLSGVGTGTLAAVWASSPSLGGISGMGLLSSPALAGELLYAGTVDGRLLVISSAGVQAASLALSSAAYASPAVANGFVYAGDMAGNLYAFSAGRAAALSSPAEGEVVNGTVAVRGYAANPALSGYDLEYSSGGSPAVWHSVASSVTASAVAGGQLAAWDTTALPNGPYALRLTVSESGPKAYANEASVNVRVNAAPQAPSALTAADAPGDSGNTLLLAWTAAPGITQYRVYRDGGAGFALLASTAPAPAAYTDASAVTGVTYSYLVRSYDGWLESPDSNTASAASVNDTGDTTPPARIADLTAEPGQGPGLVLLRWSASGDDGEIGEAARYVIKYTTAPNYDWSGFDAGAGLAVSTRGVEGGFGVGEAEEINWLTGGVTYYFALKAEDEVPNAGPLSPVATAYAALGGVPPRPPAGLLAEDAPGDDGGALDLTWTVSPDDGAGEGDVYGYRVYRRLQNAAFVSSAPYAEVGRGAASYRDEAATENVRYYYAVAAYDSTWESALSPEASGISADNYRFVDASQGSSVRLADGARVEIPGSALSQNDSIVFSRLDPATYQPLSRALAAGSANPTDVVYEVKFRNAATRLTGQARVTLPYTAADVAGMEEENLKLYTLSGGAWSLLDTSSVDAAAKKVSAGVSHFSVFRIMEYVPSGGLFSGDEVYTYPNPARGDTLSFKFRVAHKALVKVDVYNVAGEQVASLEKADCPAGQTSEITWGIKGVASGVYVYRVRAESAAGSKTVIKKLAVIH